MTEFITAFLAITVFLGAAFAAMAVGQAVRGHPLRGGCGSTPDTDGQIDGCSACEKRKTNLCDSDTCDTDDGMSLAGVLKMNTLGKYDTDR